MTQQHADVVTSRTADDPVAIVGIGGLYPRARSVDEFWVNIVDGVDCLQDVPDEHWKVAEFYDPDPQAEDRTYSNRGGFLPSVPFYPMDFGIPPNTLQSTDVVQLLSLVVAREVLADAGAGPDAGWYRPDATGVVLGLSGALAIMTPLATRIQTPALSAAALSMGFSERDTDELVRRFKKAFVPWDENSFPGLLSNVVAGRIANRLGLGGMNCTVDAACASSLASVEVAVRELASRRVDMMIAGGCAVDNTILSYVCFSKTPALSRSGRIRPFDRDADGTLLGDGIGMVALRRLADAERDGNRIYAVIRGIGTASDGRFTSIYAPRREGQELALRRAYEDARVSPASVGLFEAHGTGTPAGDGVELSALHNVLHESGAAAGSAAIGSVKSQIGHTKAAAGAAGLLKVTMALHNKVLPPTINVEQPSAAFDGSSLYVNSTARPWFRGSSPRRAAVSSFGFGGTNYHCVLEEYEGAAVPPPTTMDVAIWHSPDPATLAARLLAGDPPDSPGAIPSAHARIGFVHSGQSELADLRTVAAELVGSQPDSVSWQHPRGIFGRRAAIPASAKVAALFAGQGSQYVNMGRTAAIAIPRVHSAFEALGGLSAVVFPAPAKSRSERSAQEDLLRQTENAQPAIGALAMGQYQWLSAAGFQPSGCIGHSFGELTALWAAGSLTDSDFRALTIARGRAMASVGDVDTGTMAALTATHDVTAGLLADFPDLEICNVNAPKQIVVGGPTESIAALLTSAARRSIEARRLPVSAAFHTKLVKHASTAFTAALDSVQVTQPRIPVYANTSDAAYGADPAANAAVLSEQLLRPVVFAQRLEEMYQAGFRVFVEFGPKAVLSGLVSETLSDVFTIPTDAGPRGDSCLSLTRAALHLAVLGIPVIPPSATPGREPLPSKGTPIELHGVNHVTEQAKEDYREALAAPYQIERPVPDLAPAPSTSEEPMATNGELSNLIREQLAIHGGFLDQQLRVVNESITAITTDPGRWSHEGPLHHALRLVTEHGRVIAEAHTRANELFLSWLQLQAQHPEAAQSPAPAVVTPVAAAMPVTEPVVAVPAVAEPLRVAPAVTPAAMTAPVEPGAVAPVAVAVESAVAEPVAVKPLATAMPVTEPVVAVPAVAEPLRVAPAVTPAAMTAPVEPGAVAPVAVASLPSAVESEAAAAARSLLFDVVADKTGYPVSILDTSMDIEADLGIDSIKRVRIVSALQEQFPLIAEVEPSRIGELRTLGDVVALLAGSSPEPAVRHPAAGGVARMKLASTSLHTPQVDLKAYRDNATALVIDDGSPAAAAAVEELQQAGIQCLLLAIPTVDRTAGTLPDWDERTLTAALASITELDLCVQFACAPASSADEAVRRLTHALLVAKAVQPKLRRGAKRVGYVTFSQHATDLASAMLSGISGLVRTVAIEAPEIYARAVELDQDVRAAIKAELFDVDAGTREVRYDGSRRTTLVPEQHTRNGSTIQPPGEHDLVVVTGGARGVVAECLIEFARRFPSRLLILGRTRLEPEPGWAAGLTGRELKAAIIEKAGVTVPREAESVYRDLLARREAGRTMRLLAEAGVQAEYLPVDILDREAVRTALRPFTDKVTGLVHGAGVIADKLLADKDAQSVAKVVGTKLLGLDNVLSALDIDRLRHVVMFSSVAGVVGNAGQADYAMANAALNRATEVLKQLRPESRITSVSWGPWDSGMMTPELREVYADRGVALIQAETGAGMFAEQFTAPHGSDVLVLVGASQ